MKNNLRKIIVASSFLLFILYLFTFQPVRSNSNQPPAGETDDPVNTMSCAQHGCHSSYQPFNSSHAAITIGTSLSNQVPLSGFQYVAGTQYVFTFTALGGSQRPGFEMSALTYTNANAGSFAVTNASNTSLGTAGNIKYIGHKNANSNSTWNFNWTAPASNVGNITFYTAVNRTNDDDSSLGDSIFLQQIAITPAPFSVNAGNNVSICPNTSTQLQATATNNPATVSYSWSPTSGLSCNNCSNPVANPSSNTTYTVTATSSGQTATNTVTVNVYQPFTPVINTTSNYICPGGKDTLSVTGYSGYSWNTGATSSSITIIQQGTYTITATNSNNCLASNSIIIQQGQPPSPSITPAKPYLCNSASDTLSAGNFSNYVWNNNATTSFINTTQGGNYSVTVTNQQGCTAAASYNLPAYSSPVANVSASGPLTFCDGGSVTLNVDTGTGDTYKWSNGLTTSSISVAQSGTYMVTVYNPCDSAVSSPKVVTVNPVVTPGLNINASANNICQGTSVTFTATPTNGGSSPAYQWTKNGNNVSANSIYTDSSLVNNDTIACHLISNAVCASPDNASSNSIIMSVNPVLTPSIAINASQTTTCIGGNVVFTANAVNSGTSPVYQWTKNGNNVGANSISYSDSTLNNNDVIACTLTSNAICALPVMATSNSISITLSNTVSPAVTITGPPVICTGGSVSFNAAPTNGGSNPSYQWIKNGTIVGTNSSAYASDSLSNNDTISCIMLSNASCAYPLSVTSNIIIAVLSPTLTPAIDITASTLSICAGVPDTFAATPVNGGTTPSYQWKKNGNNTGVNSSVYIDQSLSNNDIITCVFTSSANCASPSLVVSDSVIVSVTPLVTPSVIILVSPADTVCSGTLLTFTAAISHGGPSPVYQWQVNTNNVTGIGNSYSSASLTDGAQINVVLTSNATCISSASATSDTVTVSIKPKPYTPTITPLGSDSLSCSLSADSYNWLLANEQTTFSTKKIKPLQNGLYSVIVTSDTSPVYNFIINGEELLEAGWIKLYPNPVNDMLTFDVSLANENNLKVTVMSLDGRNMVPEKNIGLSINGNNFQEDLSTLPEGIYIVYLQGNNFKKAFKIVKTK